MENKVEKIFTDDGRRAEKRYSIDEAGNRVVEIWAEEKSPLKLAEKIIERSEEVVVERIIETVDPTTGEVLDRKVEAVEPTMELREHQVSEPKAVSEYMTKSDFLEAMAQISGNKVVAKQVSAKNIVKQNVESSSENKDAFNIILMVVLAGLLGVLAYQWFV